MRFSIDAHNQRLERKTMNVIVIVSVVLIAAVIAAVVTMRRRPRPDRTHVTVADLRARLAEEAERLHPDSPVGVEHAEPRELGRSA
ncbi:hypothetical protein AB0E01_11290 [Nocardia vinacea]|uniref:hypothetical protein n=1 Tax=Nocardia vinacea TaxID=96468 RepID=UPI00340223BD